MTTILKTPEKLIMRLGCSYSLLNAIRRSVEEIPILAVDDVEIFKNDSALYDEFLAHRIGLVPLKMDSKMSSKTEISLKLKKTGPCTVYSKDLIGSVNDVYKEIPLTILEKGQEIELVATARLGLGVKHAKHSPGICYYRHLLKIKSNSKIDEIIRNSKSKIIKSEKKGNFWICDLNESEIDEILKIDKEAVSDSDEFIFFIESFGQLDAEKVLKNAIEILETNLNILEKNIK